MGVQKDIDNKIPIEKEIVNMYITARQFKNAISMEEMIIIPSYNIENLEGKILSFGDSIKITARGNKIINKIFPFLVNKAFACEVYLKILLLDIGIKKEDLNQKERHDLSKLYEKTIPEFKEQFMQDSLKKFGENANKNFLEVEIGKIANVFKEWRYIYEEADKENIVNYGFLNYFCDYLDYYSSELILKKYNYDVNSDCR